jgi:hypothetical protein
MKFGTEMNHMRSYKIYETLYAKNYVHADYFEVRDFKFFSF